MEPWNITLHGEKKVTVLFDFVILPIKNKNDQKRIKTMAYSGKEGGRNLLQDQTVRGYIFVREFKNRNTTHKKLACFFAITIYCQF